MARYGGSAQPYWAVHRNLDLDEAPDEVNGEASVLGAIFAVNESASPRYLKIYDAEATDVTVGTTVPRLTLPIPTSGDTNGSGWILPPMPRGIWFGNGITVAVTTGLADGDTGAPGANEVICHVFYK